LALGPFLFFILLFLLLSFILICNLLLLSGVYLFFDHLLFPSFTTFSAFIIIRIL
jgi:hypothetical protein